MNKARRKRLEKAATILAGMSESWADALAIIEECQQEESEAFENLTEGLQAAERGQRIEEIAQELDEIKAAMEDLDIDYLVARIESCYE